MEVGVSGNCVYGGAVAVCKRVYRWTWVSRMFLLCCIAISSRFGYDDLVYNVAMTGKGLTLDGDMCCNPTLIFQCIDVEMRGQHTTVPVKQ